MGILYRKRQSSYQNQPLYEPRASSVSLRSLLVIVTIEIGAWNTSHPETCDSITVVIIRKSIYISDQKFTLNFMVILNVYRCFIANETVFTKYCLTPWISKLPRSFEIHWVRQYLLTFTGPMGMIKCNCLQVNFHRSWAWQIVLIFNTGIT